MNHEFDQRFEAVKALQEWGSHFRDKAHPVALTLFRAAAIIVTDIQIIKNFAAEAGTVQQASTKGLSGLGGDTFKNLHGIFNYWHDASECRCQSHSAIGGCLKCDMELAIKLVNHENKD